MAALVTLQAAKDHLNVTDDAHNSDIYQKVLEASAIVEDYLTGRIATVSSLTYASGLVTVTFAHLHGLSTGDTVTVSGAVETDYNGTFAVTVTSTTALTYAISGTPTTPATGTLRIRVRQTWTSTTVPRHVRSAVLLWLTHLYENRGDDMTTDELLWAATRRLLERSRDAALA